MRRAPLIVALIAILAAALSLWKLAEAESGVLIEHGRVGATPVAVFRPEGAAPAPAVLVAHGFAGSRPLMRAFATTLARNGYVAVTYDFLGHGRHPEPLTGDVTREDGATRRLLDQTAEIAAFARAHPAADGRLAILGHSMAADIIVRFAQEDDVATAIPVSMFSPVVTADSPPSMLIIVGEWETFLVEEALRALRAFAGEEAGAGVTYGDPAEGRARRVAIADNVEHIGVLYSPEAMAEARDWLGAVFEREGTGYADARGPWVLTLIFAMAALAWPLSTLLPPLVEPHRGAALRGRAFWIAALGPAIATPLILSVAKVSFLPVVVGDYLAEHFALYGLLTTLALWRLGGLGDSRGPWPKPLPVLAAAAAVSAYALIGVGRPLDAYVSSFTPTLARLPILAALFLGTLPYFIADEWLTRGPGAPRWGS
jgi:dienelactone hydrolase